MVEKKKRTFNKMQWGVRAFSEWRNEKLKTGNADEVIVKRNLDNV